MSKASATPAARRIAREERTIRTMAGMYCRGVHGRREGLCERCSALLDYARERLRACPFRAAKPTCANCTIHCYRPDMRKKVRAVMRYAGPRMAFRHPVLALLHLKDGMKRAPRTGEKGG